jgi:hypothetical protein
MTHSWLQSLGLGRRGARGWRRLGSVASLSCVDGPSVLARHCRQAVLRAKEAIDAGSRGWNFRALAGDRAIASGAPDDLVQRGNRSALLIVSLRCGGEFLVASAFCACAQALQPETEGVALRNDFSPEKSRYICNASRNTGLAPRNICDKSRVCRRGRARLNGGKTAVTGTSQFGV